MAGETRRELYKFAKHFILNKYSIILLPKYFTQNVTKYTTISDKSQMLITAARSQYYRCIGENVKERLFLFLRSKHCHSIAAQRVRRTVQISDLYRSLGYDFSSFRSIYQNVLNSLLSRIKFSPSFLLGAAIFSWNEGKISDIELEKASHEIEFLARSDQEDAGWERLVVKEEVQVLRKPICNSNLFQYKVLGSYKDVSASSFFNIQIDLDFRKKWDKNVISLDMIDQDDHSGSEVVHWITQFPYPLSSREYIYVRRYRTDHRAKMMVIVNRSVKDHPSVQPMGKHVRVTEYCSKMVIRPHHTFDEDGFDFVLTYFDDPKSCFPKMAQSWAASSGIPDFVDKLHKAALMLQEQKMVSKMTLLCKPDLNNDDSKEKNQNINSDVKVLSIKNAILNKENIDTNSSQDILSAPKFANNNNKINNNEPDTILNNNNTSNNPNNTSNKQIGKSKGPRNRHQYTDSSSLPL